MQYVRRGVLTLAHYSGKWDMALTRHYCNWLNCSYMFLPPPVANLEMRTSGGEKTENNKKKLLWWQVTFLLWGEDKKFYFYSCVPPTLTHSDTLWQFVPSQHMQLKGHAFLFFIIYRTVSTLTQAFHFKLCLSVCQKKNKKNNNNNTKVRQHWLSEWHIFHYIDKLSLTSGRRKVTAVNDQWIVQLLHQKQKFMSCLILKINI